MMPSVLYRALDVRELQPSEEELSARLRVPIGFRDKRAEALKRELLASLSPAMCAVRVALTRADEGALYLGDIRTESEALKKSLHGCEQAFLFAVTLGLSCERWLHRISLLSPAEHFLADALASAYAEAAAELASDILAEGCALTPRFSPGYADLPLSLQKDMIRITEANKYLHIELHESLLMVPQKSITAIAGIRR